MKSNYSGLTVKTLTAGLLAVYLMLSGQSVLAAGANAMANSAHDFSNNAMFNGGGDWCTVCHTPHNANGAAAAPLWDHAISGATFTPYGNTVAGTTTGSPTGISLLCYSCHDGVTGMNSYGGVTGTNVMNNSTTALLGVDMTDDHPISITYTAANGLAATTAAVTLLTKAGTTAGTVGADLLFSSSIECASCHDVHNDTSESFLLRVSMTNAELCQACHDK